MFTAQLICTFFFVHFYLYNVLIKKCKSDILEKYSTGIKKRAYKICRNTRTNNFFDKILIKKLHLFKNLP